MQHVHSHIRPTAVKVTCLASVISARQRSPQDVINKTHLIVQRQQPRVKAACVARSRHLYVMIKKGKANMTTSIKPEVRNVSLRRQRRAEPRP